MFFFFQAEDGIRDLVRSRGLGDVYKRQVEGRFEGRRGLPRDVVLDLVQRVADRHLRGDLGTVSYTHLTLPTSDLV